MTWQTCQYCTCFVLDRSHLTPAVAVSFLLQPAHTVTVFSINKVVSDPVSQYNELYRVQRRRFFIHTSASSLPAVCRRQTAMTFWWKTASVPAEWVAIRRAADGQATLISSVCNNLGERTRPRSEDGSVAVNRISRCCWTMEPRYAPVDLYQSYAGRRSSTSMVKLRRRRPIGRQS